MYAVIRTGGKQYRVEPGQRLEVERLKVDGAAPDAGAEVDLAPVLLVDGEKRARDACAARPAPGCAPASSATPRPRRSGDSPTSPSPTSGAAGGTASTCR